MSNPLGRWLLNLFSSPITISLLMAGMLSCSGSSASVPLEPDPEPDPAPQKSIVTLLLSWSDSEWTEYLSRSRQSIDCVVEAYRQGSSECARHAVEQAALAADGAYEVEIEIEPGSYEFLIWLTPPQADGAYYDTSDLRAVRYQYSNSEDIALRLAYCASVTAKVASEATEVPVPLIRPFAIYSLYVLDVAEYLEKASENGWPADLSLLGAKVCYEGYYPVSYNVSSGAANDAVTGISYALDVTLDQEKQILVGHDIVLAGADDSFLQVRVEIYEIITGEVVTATSGIKIPYRQGCATTVEGNWLCQSSSQGGVGIDPEWNEIVVPF